MKTSKGVFLLVLMIGTVSSVALLIQERSEKSKQTEHSSLATEQSQDSAAADRFPALKRSVNEEAPIPMAKRLEQVKDQVAQLPHGETESRLNLILSLGTEAKEKSTLEKSEHESIARFVFEQMDPKLLSAELEKDDDLDTYVLALSKVYVAHAELSGPEFLYQLAAESQDPRLSEAYTVAANQLGR